MTHVIITGGSSGIGLEMARIYLRRGDRVSLLARRGDLLAAASRDLSGSHPKMAERIQVVSVDVVDEGALKLAVQKTEAKFGPCDVLVASAGRVDPAFFEVQSPEIFQAQIDVNFIGVVNAVRSVYGGMKAREKGRILIVSSGAAHIGIPGYAAYCASKSALKGFAEALWVEARGFGVSVSTAYPPDTRTPQYEQEILARPAAAARLMGRLQPWPVETVARRIVRGTDFGTKELNFGFALVMLSWFGSFIKPFLYGRFPYRPRK